MADRFDNKRIPFDAAYTKKLAKELRRYGVSVSKQIDSGTAAVTFTLEGRFLSREGMKQILTELWNNTGSFFANYQKNILKRQGFSGVPDLESWGDYVQKYFDDTSLAGSQSLQTIVDTQENTIRNIIKDTLEEGTKEGFSIDKIRKNVKDRLTGKEFRLRANFDATRIARTEVANASNSASLEQAKLVGDRILKSWNHIGGDGRTWHAEEESKTINNPIPIDQPFNLNSGSVMQRPHDSGNPREVVNCRCRLRYHKV